MYSTSAMKKMAGYLAALLLASAPCAAQPVVPADRQTKRELIASSKEIARAAKEIERLIEDERAHPATTLITPSTKTAPYAEYYKKVESQLAGVDTSNFPMENGEKLHGHVLVAIPIDQDGKLSLRNGGPSIEKSSGLPAFDEAVLDLIRRAAPFAPFPRSALSPDRKQVWVIITSIGLVPREAQPAEEAAK